MTTIVTEDLTRLVGLITEGLILVSLDMAPIVEEPFPSIGPLDTSEMVDIGTLTILKVEETLGGIELLGARGLVVEEADPIALVEVVHLEGNKYGMARFRN